MSTADAYVRNTSFLLLQELHSHLAYRYAESWKQPHACPSRRFIVPAMHTFKMSSWLKARIARLTGTT